MGAQHARHALREEERGGGRCWGRWQEGWEGKREVVAGAQRARRALTDDEGPGGGWVRVQSRHSTPSAAWAAECRAPAPGSHRHHHPIPMPCTCSQHPYPGTLSFITARHIRIVRKPAASKMRGRMEGSREGSGRRTVGKKARGVEEKRGQAAQTQMCSQRTSTATQPVG